MHNTGSIKAKFSKYNERLKSWWFSHMETSQLILQSALIYLALSLWEFYSNINWLLVNYRLDLISSVNQDNKNNWQCESKQNVMKLRVQLVFNPLSANRTKWPNTLKQFVAKLPTNCLSVFDQFLKLVLKGVKRFLLLLQLLLP